MKIAVIGATGQLGSDLCKVIPARELIPLTHSDIEISDINSVEKTLKKHKPDVVINTAAYIRVDDCETNIDTAYKVNSLGARNVAVISQELDARLVYLSTDYVFGGDISRRNPYAEYDDTSPINVYGKSLLAGELNVRHFCNKHFIVRTSALFGVKGSQSKGGNFVENILKLASANEKIEVVDDQITSPTYSKDLAKRIYKLVSTKYYGIIHITNSGYCTWYEFAREIINKSGYKTAIVPIKSGDYPCKARRPEYSVLDNYVMKLLNMNDMQTWQSSLQEYLEERKT